MNTRILVGGLLVLALLIFGATLWFSFQEEREKITPEVGEETGFVPQTITAKHQFNGGVHTIAGEVDLPTACDLLETDSFVEVREPASDRAVIQFTTINESEACAQVITSARFKTSFNATEDADIIATWNGQPVSINLIEVGPNENLDDFELFIKG